MAFKTKIQIKEKEYDVLDCTYSFRRNVDVKGRPSSNVYGGNIFVTIESNDDTNIAAQLMVEDKPFDGSVTFHKGGEPTTMQKLSWENGYIVNLNETVDVTDKEPMQTHFEIRAEKLTLGSETIDHKWPK